MATTAFKGRAGGTPPDSLERIRAAIKAHRAAIEQLEGMIGKESK